jgi:hypothetical protein
MSGTLHLYLHLDIDLKSRLAGRIDELGTAPKVVKGDHLVFMTAFMALHYMAHNGLGLCIP